MYSKNEIQSVCCTKTTTHVMHRFTSLRKRHKFCSTVAVHQSRTFYTLLEESTAECCQVTQSHAKFTIQQSSQYNNSLLLFMMYSQSFTGSGLIISHHKEMSRVFSPSTRTTVTRIVQCTS